VKGALGTPEKSTGARHGHGLGEGGLESVRPGDPGLPFPIHRLQQEFLELAVHERLIALQNGSIRRSSHALILL
jgi:hypothetical protein